MNTRLLLSNLKTDAVIPLKLNARPHGVIRRNITKLMLLEDKVCVAVDSTSVCSYTDVSTVNYSLIYSPQMFIDVSQKPDLAP
jgi:hypothetical protein